MNCKEHYLPELELATGQVREALQAILYTILFIRSPGPVAPRDVECEGFDFVTYPRIASTPSSPSNLNYDVDKKSRWIDSELFNETLPNRPRTFKWWIDLKLLRTEEDPAAFWPCLKRGTCCLGTMASTRRCKQHSSSSKRWLCSRDRASKNTGYCRRNATICFDEGIRNSRCIYWSRSSCYVWIRNKLYQKGRRPRERILTSYEYA